MHDLLHNGSLARIRVGIVSVYFALFDEQMPPGYRASKVSSAQLRAQQLKKWFDVVDPGLITSEADASRARALFVESNVDVIVFAPTMAAPPSYGILATEGIDVGLVIWNALELETFPEPLDHPTAVANAGTVGCLMFGNACMREGRPYIAVTGSTHNEQHVEEVAAAIRAAACRTTLQGAVALRVGDPIPGYADVESTPEQLALLGLTEVRIGAAELEQAVAGVPADLARELLREVGAPPGELHAAAAQRSAQVALALAELVRLHEARLGTVNCHGELFRKNAAVGVCACLGVSLLSGSGVPFSCTGDQPTAVALKVAETISGRALYCECYAPELSSDEVLIAAGGEGDLRWAETPVEVIPNEYYPGVHGCGLGVSFKIAAGDATLVSLSPSEGRWELTCAEGTIGARWHPALGGPNAMFRFKATGARRGVNAWVQAGAPHHHALASGHRASELRSLSRLEGFAFTAVE